jgi:hypothetical protein
MANSTNVTILKKKKEIELWKHYHSKEKCTFCTHYQFHSYMCLSKVINRHYCYISDTNKYKILTEEDIKKKCENFTPIMINIKKKKVYHNV